MNMKFSALLLSSGLISGLLQAPLMAADPPHAVIQATLPSPFLPQPNLPTSITAPTDIPLQPDQAIVDHLLQKGILTLEPDRQFHPQAPITRAEYAQWLFKASGLLVPFVSEYAYFRDVPTDHPAYHAIEALRMRRVIHDRKAGDGNFHPDDPIKRSQAGVMLSRTFSEAWLKLSEAEVNTVLTQYSWHSKDLNTVPLEYRADLAKSIYAGFLIPVHHIGDQKPDLLHGDAGHYLSMDLAASLTRLDAARMIYQRALLAEQEQPGNTWQVPRWPDGLEIVISPTTAISVQQLSVGQSLYFATVSSFTIAAPHVDVPRGTRLHGKVVEIEKSGATIHAQVALDRALLPSGDTYNLNAETSLLFKPDKNQQTAIVPGENIHIITQPISAP